MFRFTLLLTVFAISRVFAGPLDAAYQEGAKVAKENQNKAMEKINNYNPSEVFTYVNEKNEVIKNYNENPPETKFYHGITSDSGGDLIKAGEAAYTYNEDDKNNNASQAALKSFNKNPKIKIDPKNQNDPIIGRAIDIMENADSIATGRSSTGKGADCKESKICRIEYLKKTCNESIRPIHRICEKIPKIVVIEKERFYPNCQHFLVKLGTDPCPAGYNKILDEETYVGSSYSRMRFCTKPINNDKEILECYGGSYAFQGSDWRRTGNWKFAKTTVPKNYHAYLKSFRSYTKESRMVLTVVNLTTGKTLCYDKDVSSEGTKMELPFFKDQDQAFEFYLGYNDHDCGGRVCNSGSGAVVLFFDHTSKEKMANEPIWEESCRDV